MDVSIASPSITTTPPPDMRLGQLLRLLRRRAWLIGVLAVAGAVGGYVFARTIPKSYTASSLVAVEGDRLAIPELQGALRNDNAPDPMPWVRTEVQAIISRDLVQVVVDRLHLADVPEFNPLLRPPGWAAELKGRIMSLLPGPRLAADDASPNEAVLGSVLRSLAVFQDNRSLVIDVSFTAEDPKLAAEVVNTLIAEYIGARAGRRVNANQGANKAMTERVEQVRSDLADIEQQMRDMRNKSELVGLRAGSVGQQQLEELATAAARAGVERAQLQTTFDRATALAKQGSSDGLANVLGSATISNLREQQAAAARKVAELSTRYGSGYPGVRSAQAELSSAQRQLNDETQRIVASLGTQLRNARQHEADVQSQLEEARRASVVAENARAQLDRLQQEANTRRAMYQTLLERSQQTAVQPTGSEVPDVRVVSKAAPPGGPSSPNMKMAAGAGGVSGALLGGLLALTALRRGPAFRNAEDLSSATGLPATATLRRSHFGRGRNGLLARVTAAPGGAEAESLRELRSRLSRMGRVAVPRSVVFTGARNADEASAVAASLARVCALDGEKVLLIEGDLRQPKVAAMLGAGDDGLLPVLQGAGDWRELVAPDPDSPLDVLGMAGPVQGSQALLSGHAFQNLLVEAQAHYDLVLISAPAGTSADARTLAQRADLVALVVDGAAGQDAAGQLQGLSRNPLAVVLICP